MKKDEKVCKAYPHLILYVLLNICMGVVAVAFLCMLEMDYGETFRIVNIILAAVFSVTAVSVFIYTTCAGWVAAVRFDKEKVYQKRGKKTMIWYWQDMYEITCRTYRPRIFWPTLNYPIFKIKVRSHDRVLVFVLNEELIKKFETLCSNEEIFRQFKRLLLRCNFPFLNKYYFR